MEAGQPCRQMADHGTLGVQVFFVISGYLITTLLVSERAATGSISLRLFYVRRTLRIFPPFYAFLAVLAVFPVTPGPEGLREISPEVLEEDTRLWLGKVRESCQQQGCKQGSG